MKFKTTAIAAACMAFGSLAQAQYSNTAQPNAQPVADSPTRLVNRMAPSDSETVRQVQEQLAQRGFDPGPADGQMGAQTRGALRNFQQSKGMSDTGLDSKTLEALGVQGGTPRHATTAKGEATMGAAPAQQGAPSRNAAPSSQGMPASPTGTAGTTPQDARTAGEGTMGTTPTQQPNTPRK